MNSPSDESTFNILEAHWARDQAALMTVRTAVFVEEQGVAPDLEWDGADADALHLLACDAAGQPIGTARVMTSGQIGRMAVLPRWRGRGVGSALLSQALRLAAAAGTPAPFLHAQTSAILFYGRHGFHCTGEEFDEAGIPHRLMRLAQDSPRDSAPDDNPVLGRSEGVRQIAARQPVRAAAIAMARQARREIVLLSRDLEPELYDQPGFLDAIRTLAVSGPRLPIRILLLEPRIPVMTGHRLVELARQLTSSILIRRVGDEFQDRFESLLIIDETGYILRRTAAEPGAIASFNHRSEAARLHAEFDQIWEHSDADSELRRLHL